MVCFPRSLHPSLTDTNLMNHQNLAELAQTLFEESGDALELVHWWMGAPAFRLRGPLSPASFQTVRAGFPHTGGTS